MVALHGCANGRQLVLRKCRERLIGMTNKQAVGALNRIRCIIREDSIEEQALVYAIEIIKAQGTNVGDIIYRQAALNCVEYAAECIKNLPSAQSDITHCKDCKHWKDSDGVYRRGLGTESKCPLNLKEVYEGTFYCGMAERKE